MKEILIIDDDKMIGVIHQKLLAREGFHNTKVFNMAADALSYMESEKDSSKQFLVLLDINMPHMNGWEFAEKATYLKNLDQCTFYLVTSSIDQEDKFRASQMDIINGLIEKPLNKVKIEFLMKELDHNFMPFHLNIKHDFKNT